MICTSAKYTIRGDWKLNVQTSINFHWPFLQYIQNSKQKYSRLFQGNQVWHKKAFYCLVEIYGKIRFLFS